MSPESIRSALAKQVPDMEHGFTIGTSAGDIAVEAGWLANRLAYQTRSTLHAALGGTEKPMVEHKFRGMNITTSEQALLKNCYLSEFRITNYFLNVSFPDGRPLRSEAYRAGVRDYLLWKLCERPLKCPKKPGSSEADAWSAGCKEGHSILVLNLMQFVELDEQAL